MNNYTEAWDLPTAIPVEPPKKGQPVLAWTVIVLLVLASLGLHNVRPLAKEPATAEEDRIGTLLMEMQARYLVAAVDLFPRENSALHTQAQALDRGSLGQRLRFVVLVGELSGPRAALQQLRELEQKVVEHPVEWTATQTSLKRILRRMYQDYAQKQYTAPSLEEEDRALLRRELGWFGDLALAPAGDPNTADRRAVLFAARRTMLAVIGMVLVFGLLGVAGSVGLVVLLVLLLTGRLRGGLSCGVPHGGVYAETFALWMVLFLAFSVIAGLVPVEGGRFLVLGGAMLLSLIALAWPVLRGVPWRQVRQEVGLTAGRLPALEPALGLAGYAMTIPMLAVGVLVMVVLVTLLRGGGSAEGFGANGMPAHPIVQFLADSGWWGRLQLLLLAAVAAPIVEETMFRGVLYRHLREASVPLGFAGSVLLSATAVSFIFAAIHPQGMLAVPALMALAFGFNLVREWRGTLVPAMVAHGINNGFLLLIFLLAIGD